MRSSFRTSAAVKLYGWPAKRRVRGCRRRMPSSSVRCTWGGRGGGSPGVMEKGNVMQCGVCGALVGEGGVRGVWGALPWRRPKVGARTHSQRRRGGSSPRTIEPERGSGASLGSINGKMTEAAEGASTTCVCGRTGLVRCIAVSLAHTHSGGAPTRAAICCTLPPCIRSSRTRPSICQDASGAPACPTAAVLVPSLVPPADPRARRTRRPGVLTPRRSSSAEMDETDRPVSSAIWLIARPRSRRPTRVSESWRTRLGGRRKEGSSSRRSSRLMPEMDTLVSSEIRASEQPSRRSAAIRSDRSRVLLRVSITVTRIGSGDTLSRRYRVSSIAAAPTTRRPTMAYFGRCRII
eukprot:scaffold6505_cov79-Isochrysis_galbana.AAC.1